MALAVHAIYENGQLRLLDPIDLTEGQRVEILILPETNSVQDALSHMISTPPSDDESALDETELFQRIDAELSAHPAISLSQQVIQERRDGR